MFGEDIQERREVVYGHVFIDLPSTYTRLGTVEVAWNPTVRIPDMPLPQYLSTTVYANNGTYYLTQWTQLDTEKYYFKPLEKEATERWGSKWQSLKFTVPVNTDSQEYRQYIDYLKQLEQSLPEAFDVAVYAKRFSGRIIVRVLEFTPAEGASARIYQFNQLYPVVPYKTVEEANAQRILTP
ncbi:hypothetical protein [Halodesulfovibrio marinisediminis]|uniref:hypothetical protein n=1 Tax=Halodesulfovibrio marinisediminis TaxID=458711 RepID=UPI00111523D1|nr:hypothetical protein [Halodesulfovibrio marinisediminis]